MKTVSIVFIEVKKELVSGMGRIDVIVQALAESIGVSDIILLQLPILIILLIISMTK
jgi:hypothetical protein